MKGDLGDIADRVVGWARDGEQVEALVLRGVETSIRVYGGEIEQLSSAGSQGVGIRVVIDGRVGFAWAGTLDESIVRETLEEARDNAAFAEADEFNGLVEPDGVAPAELDLFRPSLKDVPTAAKIDLAMAVERSTMAGDPRITGIESASYEDQVVEQAVASTTGVRGEERTTVCDLTVDALAADGPDSTQAGFGFGVGREIGDLDAEAVARDAVERTTRLLGATKPASGRFTVVLDPWVTAQFLSIVGGTLSGDAVLKGYSPFADRLGEAIAAAGITLVDDPTDPRQITAGAHDGEGLATRRNVLIDGGILDRFVYDGYSARRAGVAPTGSAVRGGFKSGPSAGCQALALLPGARPQVDLLASVGDGILVQDVSGLHSGVNAVSGDFSTGAEGLRITGGALGAPLKEFTIASTLQRMLLDVLEVGADLTFLPMSAAGVSLVVGDVTVSGS